MSAALLERASPTASVAVMGESPDILASILQPAVQLALWRRPRPASLDWIDALEWDAIDDLNFVAPIIAIEAEVADGLAEAGYPLDAGRAALAVEIASLARHFAAILDLGAVKIRLEVIETDACRKFHMDKVTARLLAPLSGPGTQWIDLDGGGDAPAHQLDRGHVGIFKGRLWVEEPRILHRSPPIAASGDTRLLLVLDPAPLSDGVLHA